MPKQDEPNLKKKNILHTILDRLDSIEKLMLKKEKPFMNLIDASKYLGISKNTLYSYTSQSVIPHYKMRGRRVYFKIEDLDKFILSNDNRVSSQEEIKQKPNLHIKCRSEQTGRRWRPCGIQQPRLNYDTQRQYARKKETENHPLPRYPLGAFAPAM